MKCAKCGAEIPDDKLFCPECGAEVQLVPDYSSIDYMTEQYRADEEAKAEAEEAEELAEEEAERPSAFMTVFRVLAALACAAGLVYAVFFLVDYHNSIDYVAQKHLAEDAWNRGELLRAAACADRALALNPDSEDCAVLKASILADAGYTDEAESLLISQIEAGHDSVEVYQVLIGLYEEKGDTASAVSLIGEATNPEVARAFPSYETTQSQS